MFIDLLLCVQRLRTAASHRFQHGTSKHAIRFAEKNLAIARQMSNDLPYVDLRKEILHFERAASGEIIASSPSDRDDM